MFGVAATLTACTGAVSATGPREALLVAADQRDAEAIVLRHLRETTGSDCIVAADGLYPDPAEDRAALRALDELGTEEGWVIVDQLYAGSDAQAVAAFGASGAIVTAPGQQWIVDPGDPNRVIRMLQSTVNGREIWRFGNSIKAVPPIDCVATGD